MFGQHLEKVEKKWAPLGKEERKLRVSLFMKVPRGVGKIQERVVASICLTIIETSTMGLKIANPYFLNVTEFE